MWNPVQMNPSDPRLSPRDCLQANVARDIESVTQAIDQMVSEWGTGGLTDVVHQRGLWGLIEKKH